MNILIDIARGNIYITGHEKIYFRNYILLDAHHRTQLICFNNDALIFSKFSNKF